ncbi:hypothetical protein GCM10029992_56320 [Glycomyces albus]
MGSSPVGSSEGDSEDSSALLGSSLEGSGPPPSQVSGAKSSESIAASTTARHTGTPAVSTSSAASASPIQAATLSCGIAPTYHDCGGSSYQVAESPK